MKMDFQDSGDQDSQVPTCEYLGRLITPRPHLRQEPIGRRSGMVFCNMTRNEASNVSSMVQDTDENPLFRLLEVLDNYRTMWTEECDRMSRLPYTTNGLTVMDCWQFYSWYQYSCGD